MKSVLNAIRQKNTFGYQWLIGDLLGYNEHHKQFGKKTKATPDGRYDGDLIKFGIGQSEGKDRQELTALLNSVSKLDPHGISCGSTVTNISLDEAQKEYAELKAQAQQFDEYELYSERYEIRNR